MLEAAGFLGIRQEIEVDSRAGPQIGEDIVSQLFAYLRHNAPDRANSALPAKSKVRHLLFIQIKKMLFRSIRHTRFLLKRSFENAFKLTALHYPFINPRVTRAIYKNVDVAHIPNHKIHWRLHF